MNKKKSIGMSLAVWAIFFVIYNIAVFLFLKPVTPVFWVSWGFMILAFGLQILGMYLSFKDFTVEAVFFGIPLAQFTLYYFFAELFMSVVFMLFQALIGVKIAGFLQLALLAVYAVVAIVSVGARDAAVGIKNDYDHKTKDQKLKAIDIELLRDEAKDPELKKQLGRLAEAVRYSDPMTNAAVADVDGRITLEVMTLQAACEDGDLEGAKASCAKLQRLYVERNKKLLASK